MLTNLTFISVTSLTLRDLLSDVALVKFITKSFQTFFVLSGLLPVEGNPVIAFTTSLVILLMDSSQNNAPCTLLNTILITSLGKSGMLRIYVNPRVSIIWCLGFTLSESSKITNLYMFLISSSPNSSIWQWI